MLAAVKTRESYERGIYPKRGWVERIDVATMMYDSLGPAERPERSAQALG